MVPEEDANFGHFRRNSGRGVAGRAQRVTAGQDNPPPGTSSQRRGIFRWLEGPDTKNRGPIADEPWHAACSTLPQAELLHAVAHLIAIQPQELGGLVWLLLARSSACTTSWRSTSSRFTPSAGSLKCAGGHGARQRGEVLRLEHVAGRPAAWRARWRCAARGRCRARRSASSSVLRAPATGRARACRNSRVEAVDEEARPAAARRRRARAAAAASIGITCRR